MTILLEKAVQKTRELPAAEQDALAKLLLEEIESEEKWDKLLTKAPEKLTQLADQAWAEHDAGLSQPLDPDQL